MARIVNKLNLNKTPQLVDNNSMIFAKNIKLLKDGCIAPDDAIKSLYSNYNIFATITGLNSKVYLFVEDRNASNNPIYKILEYNEITEAVKEINSGWNYNGGVITGCVTNNILNETILTICEKPTDDVNLEIPIKHININTCKSTDDESIYTQNPKIPISNLYLTKTYTKNIPNGVYQFFIRYKVNNDLYTNWIPCSKECFAGSSELTRTVQGDLKHINIHKDSRSSFVFAVEHLFDQFNSFFTEYQIGFILSHDDAVVARSWKSFTFDVNEIYFDYDEVEEINTDDLLKVNFELFNVENITYYKNKLYIADYKETDFNPDLVNNAKEIKVDLVQKTLNATESVSVGNYQLQSTGEYGNLYDKWGSKDIYGLYNSDLNSVKKDVVSGKGIDSKNEEYGIITAKANWRWDVDPDIYWIYQVLTNTKNYNVFDFTARTTDNWKTSGYFNIYGDYTDPYGHTQALIAENKHNHPLENLPLGYRGKWYYASGSANTNIPTAGDHDSQFFVFNNGFTDYHLRTIARNFENSLLLSYREHLPATLLLGAYLLDSNRNKVYILGRQSWSDNKKDSVNLDGVVLSTFYKLSIDEITNYIQTRIKNDIIAVDQEGFYYIKFEDEVYKFDQLVIEYSEFDYTIKSTVADTTDSKGHEYRIDCTRTNKDIIYSVKVNDRNVSNTFIDAQRTTLMPFTEYEFYVHYVKNNGVCTNGYLIDSVVKDTYDYGGVDDNKLVNVIYPKFSNIKIPTGYDACFISIYKKGADIARGFNHAIKNGYHYIDCLECDTLLYNATDNITILDSNGVEISDLETDAPIVGTYYGSGTTSPLELFGNSGCIRWKVSDKGESVYDSINYPVVHLRTDSSSNIFAINFGTPQSGSLWSMDITEDTEMSDIISFISKLNNNYKNILNYTVTKTEEGFDVKLIAKQGKLVMLSAIYSPYPVSDFRFGELINENKIEAELIDNSSYNGYWIKINSQKGSNKNKALIKLTPYITDKERYDDYDNYNMPGYVNKVYKLDRDAANSVYIAGTDVYDKEFVNTTIRLNDYDGYMPLVASTPAYIMSNFNLNYCDLSEDITPQIRKYYESDETIKLQQIISSVNSLTSSYILELSSMYKDYTRKTYIPYDPNSNIIEFNNTIRSSTVNSDEQHKSIYEFKPEDYYNIPTNRGKIVSLFNIVEHIYVHTEHSLFKFSGHNTLSSEDSEISLKEGNPFDTGIVELFDTNNGYAGLQSKNHSVVTYQGYIFYDKLANTIYAYKGNANITVISDSIDKILKTFNIIDIWFAADEYNNRLYINLITDEGNICLSYNYKLNTFISIHDFSFSRAFHTRLHTYFIKADEEITNLYKLDKTRINDYSTLFTKSVISISDMEYDEEATTHMVENCVDIVYNKDYEIPKILEFVEWINSDIKKYGYDNNLCAEETLDYTYLGCKLRIYSDTTHTKLFDFTNDGINPNRQNDYPVTTEQSYVYPRYNTGVWSFNYFRDVKNNNDIFDYESHDTLQDKSLVYGKYFVLRFIFRDKNFKLENVHFNVTRK